MTRLAEVSSCQAIVLESVINVALNIRRSFLLLIFQIFISNIFALQCISVINFITCMGNNQKLCYSVITVLHHSYLAFLCLLQRVVVVLFFRHLFICHKIHSGFLYITCLQVVVCDVSFQI